MNINVMLVLLNLKKSYLGQKLPYVFHVAAMIHKNLCHVLITTHHMAQVEMTHIAPQAQALAVLDALAAIVPPVSKI